MGTLDEPLSIRQLEVFIELVARGSFTEAARALGLSQSTVSGHVADLERRLGTQVVERSRHGVRPTAAGDVLLAPARETLKAERTTRMAVEELTGLLRGTLVVGGSTIPATYVLPGLLARYRARHPEIALRLVTGDSRDVVDRVLAADVELGIVGSAPDVPGLAGEKIAEDRLILILPPTHRFVGRGSIEAADVVAEPLVLREEGSGTREATLRLLASAGVPADESLLRIGCEVGSTEGTKAAVKAGLGLAFISDLAVRDEIAAGRLATVPVLGCETVRPLYLVTRIGTYLGPAARAFRELAVEE